MIESFEIANFRGFDHLKIGNLRRINIVVGRSSSGKTALLEGIRLATGATPAVAWQVNAMRNVIFGMQQYPIREQFEALWSSLFLDFNLNKTIKTVITNSEKKTASLNIYFDKDKAITPISPQLEKQVLASTIIPLAFFRTSFSGETTTLNATINPQGGGLQLEQGTELKPPAILFPPHSQFDAAQAANWFSQLSVNNNEKEIVEIIKKQFPEVLDLSVQALMQFPVLHATVKHRQRKMPLSLISSGISKFVAILTAIRIFGSGTVLIDEIENGIYYQMFPAFWRALHELAVKSNTQLFLSTHSWECLRSASDVIEKSKEDFSLIQIFQEEGRSKAFVVQGTEAAAAIEGGIEVRG
jgi:AAA15 family ATPase/GTPase